MFHPSDSILLGFYSTTTATQCGAFKQRKESELLWIPFWKSQSEIELRRLLTKLKIKTCSPRQEWAPSHSWWERAKASFVCNNYLPLLRHKVGETKGSWTKLLCNSPQSKSKKWEHLINKVPGQLGLSFRGEGVDGGKSGLRLVKLLSVGKWAKFNICVTFSPPK